MDRTLILVKPDAFARNLTGEILARFERKGLRIAAMNLMTMDRALAEQHYAGHEAVVAARQVIGATNPLEAAPGSIRGDFALEVGRNMVHGSDSNESAAREVGLFFPDL